MELKEFLFDARPWGNFKQFTHNEISTVKILTVTEGGVLSKQKHKHRSELWVMLDDGLKVELDDNVLLPKKGDEIFIPAGSVHRLSSDVGGRVLEVSFGHFDENDIERLEDVYERK